MATQVSGETMSYEEFLAAYDGQHAEWVSGKVVPMSPVSERHQDIADFFTALLRYLAEESNAGVVRSAPFQMRAGEAAREPDVLFVSTEHRDRLKASHLEGPPDLVVEVISPDSRVRDRGEKFYEYEQAGVREYWLVDPLREQAELYRLGERGVFEAVSPGEPPRLGSEVLPGFWIDPAWLWRDRLPKLSAVLREWGLV